MTDGTDQGGGDQGGPDLGALGGLGGMMDMVRKAQEQAMSAQAEMERILSTTVVEGSSGGGMVHVKMTAAGQIRSVKIEPEVVDPKEVEMLEDLVLAAVNAASRKAAEARKAVEQNHMSQLTSGLGGPGGMDLSKLFGG